MDTSKKASLTATCRCKAVRLTFPAPDKALNECLCSICGRYGVLVRITSSLPFVFTFPSAPRKPVILSSTQFPSNLPAERNERCFHYFALLKLSKGMTNPALSSRRIINLRKSRLRGKQAEFYMWGDKQIQFHRCENCG